MSTFKKAFEIRQTALDAVETIRNELKHYPDSDEYELISQEADRQCIYTQDNWDVVNLMRCSDEMDEAEAMAGPLSEYADIDTYMTALAYSIWDQLISEEFNKEQDDE